MEHKREIFICINKRAGGPACIGKGSRDVFRAFRNEIQKRGSAVEITRNVCMGYCGVGPNVKIRGGGFFHSVTPEDVKRILDTEQALDDAFVNAKDCD